MKKKEPDFITNTDNLNAVDITENKNFSKNFVEGLFYNFASGAVDYLDAKRLINSSNPKSEVELIANDEQIKLSRKHNYLGKNIFE